MRTVVPAVLLLTVACDESPSQKDLTLGMSFLSDGGMCSNVIGAGPCGNVETCPLDCSVEIVLRAARSDSGAEVGVQCQRFDGEDQRKLSALPELLAEMVDKFDWPADTEVDLELAVYSPVVAETCPEADFDRSPPESPGGNRPNYYARARRVRVEEEAVARLDLVCLELHSRCDSLNVDFTTDIWAIRASTARADDPQNLVVRLAQLIVDGPGVSFNVITPMTWNGSVVPMLARWTATVNEEDLEGPCVATVVNRLSNPVLSCFSDIDGAVGVTQGIEIEDDVRMLINSNLGGVPPEGLFVGRVVTKEGNPVAGATVQPVEGQATIVYLDGSMKPTGARVTQEGGWVAIRERPRFDYTDATGGTEQTSCCGYFAVQAGALVGCSKGPVGLVNDTLTAGLFVVDQACPTVP
jgi:hypothetical protein